MDRHCRFGRGVKAGAVWAVLSTAWPAGAAVDLSLQPVEDPVAVGQTLSVTFIATNDAAGEAQLVSAITAVLVWDKDVLRLVGVDNNGPIPWLASGFLADPDGINDSLDDGDAIYTALASPGGPAGVPDAGLLITTLEFEALGPSPSSAIDIVLELGLFGRTQVFDGTVANLDVLGSFEGTSVTVVCGKSDTDSDHDVDVVDFAFFQNCFTGQATSASPICLCFFDSDDDEDIDVVDYQALLLSFTGPL